MKAEAELVESLIFIDFGADECNMDHDFGTIAEWSNKRTVVVMECIVTAKKHRMCVDWCVYVGVAGAEINYWL